MLNIDNMNKEVKVTLHSISGVQECEKSAIFTHLGKFSATHHLSLKSWLDILNENHSPAKLIQFEFTFEIPDYISMQLRSHHVGILHFVLGSRIIDPEGNYNKMTKDKPTHHLAYINYIELKHILNQRSTPKCHSAMRDLCTKIKDELKRWHAMYNKNDSWKNVILILNLLLNEDKKEIQPCGQIENIVHYDKVCEACKWEMIVYNQSIKISIIPCDDCKSWWAHHYENKIKEIRNNGGDNN